VLALGIAGAFTACSFNPGGLPIGCEPPGCPVDFSDGKWIPEEIDIIAENAALTTVTNVQRRRSPNGDGSNDFQSHHGSGCADATRAAVRLPNGEDLVGIRIQDNIELPSLKHTGMVYLNGWELSYSGDDHNVKGLGAWITKVRQENGALHWEAGGVLTDKNADDAYRWCYAYTVVMWNTDVIDAYVIQGNFEHSQTFVHERSQTATLRELPGAHEGPTVPWVVPRAFGLMFDGDYVDHHILQAAVEFDDAISWQGPWFSDIVWRGLMILNDNSTRSFLGTEMVSIVGGPKVGMRPGRFSMQARTPAGGGCIKQPGSTRAEWITVPDLPYDYAVPVLAGWDIGYPCEDHELKKMGTQITHFGYEKAPGAATGTLSYRITSVLQDKNADDGMLARAKVNVLGFRRD
jgi:hypothetical protein